MDTKIHTTTWHSKSLLLYLLKVVGANIASNVKSSVKPSTWCHHDKRRQGHPAKQHQAVIWYLTTSEKCDWLEHLHNLQWQTKRQVDHLWAKIAKNIKHKGVIIDEGIHDDIIKIVPPKWMSCSVTTALHVEYQPSKMLAQGGGTHSW